MALLYIVWKFWTGVLMVGAGLGWWSWGWPLVLFVGPEVIGFFLLLGVAAEGRKVRKAEERAASKPGGD